MATRTYTAEETAKLKTLYSKLSQLDDITIPKARDTGGQTLTAAINERNSIAREITAIQTSPAVTPKGAPLTNQVGRITQDTAKNQITNQDPAKIAQSSPLSTTEASNIKKADQNVSGPNAGTPLTSKNKTESPNVEPGVTPGALATAQSSGMRGPIEAPEVSVTAQRIIELTPIMNPLHKYASYTYGLSLHMLTVDEYNELLKNQNYVPKRVLIASAGRYNNSVTNTGDSFVRNQHFNDDFYFENLNLHTVVGLNDHSRASNAINLNFSVIEPYGITLMNRILRVAEEVKSSNYTEQPYLLQIDFFGYDDTGKSLGLLSEHTKRIPIRILKLDIKATMKGSEYHFECSPYNHSAFDIGTVKTPAHFEVVAGSVASFFQSTEDENAFTTVNNEREEFTREYGIVNSANQRIGPSGQLEYVPLAFVPEKYKNVASQDPIYRVKSYGSAINAWNAELARKNKIEVADTYFFKFHPNIATSTFTLSEKLPHKDTPMTGIESAPAHRKSNAGANTAGVDYTVRNFSVNTGTSLDQVINYVIRNSTYVQNQIEVPEDYGTDIKKWEAAKQKISKEPLQWFRVVPTIKLGKYCNVRKKYSREITYYVVPYTVYNTKTTIGPQGQAENPIKDYNYLYTGKNLDIIDFNIDFNFLYYSSVTAYRNYFQQSQSINQDESYKTANPEQYSKTVEEQKANALQQLKEIPQTLDAKARATGSEVTTKGAAAVDLEQTLYTKQGADMLQIDLKIVGDPQWIKQDDIFYPPTVEIQSVEVDGTGIDNRLIANGSLHMDKGELYIQITFKSPVDMDEATSLAKFEPQYEVSLFSGLFRVLTIDSVFSGGQFIQTLHAVRLFKQKKAIYTTGAPVESTQRNVDNPGVTAVSSNNQSVQASDGTANPATTEEITPRGAPAPEPTTGIDKTAQDLKKINQTAPTTEMTQQNEPNATVPSNITGQTGYGAGWTENFTSTQLAYLQQTQASLGLNANVFTAPISSDGIARLKAQLAQLGIQ